MSFQKKSTYLILISLVILGCVNTRKLSLPLKINKYERLYFSIKYGSKQCEVPFYPDFGECLTNINQSYQTVEECGAISTGIHNYNTELQYIAPFQLGNTQTILQFTAPPTKDPYYHDTLCLGIKSNQFQNITLFGLFENGQVIDRVFINLNGTKSQDESIGEIDIGAPNLSLIKKDANIVKLKSDQFNKLSATVSGNIQLFGKELDSRSQVYLNLDTPFHLFTIQALQEILSIFDKQGIIYTTLQEKIYEIKVFLPSIEKLENITINLVKEDNTNFPIIIQPSQYTRQLANGEYQLLIKPLFYTDCFQLSYTILETYYIGYNLYKESWLIAEKDYEQVHNFRGSLNISE